MRLYHFGIVFAILALGFFVSVQIRLITKLQQEEWEKTEYDVLVAAVNASAEEVFYGTEPVVTKTELDRAEEVFFQTLAVLFCGKTDRASWEEQKAQVPCLVVFDTKGYYVYSKHPEEGYGWSECCPYGDGEIPERFFSETEVLLQQYHAVESGSKNGYRMEKSGRGIWEQSLIPPCVFAVYVPKRPGNTEDNVFLYAASGRMEEVFYVTEDNYCHVPSCAQYNEEFIVAWYGSQKESAEDGAIPCEQCLKGVYIDN